ncbi:MAG TPA: AraC family transcriptional regulator [Paenibacillus sp.]|nr:AraC family transcriptional regulator [Paenibacillus sp.]
MKGRYVFHSEAAEHFQGDFPLFLNRWEEGFELREHDHAYIEIAYVMAGEGFHYVGDDVERTGKGRLYVLPVGTSHVFRPSGASGKSKLLVYNLCVRPRFAKELQAWLSQFEPGDAPLSAFEGEPGTHLALFDETMELAALFERMHDAYWHRPPGYAASVVGDFLQLAARIHRLACREPAAAPARRPRHPNVARVLDYVHARLAERTTVEELSAAFGVSVRHLLRLIRRSTGMGFAEYVQLRRMEAACRLLAETDEKIAAIAKSVGYRDAAHFRELFRKSIGTSPSRYRAAHAPRTPEPR